MLWPSITDYQEVIQNPSICFGDIELKNGKPVLDHLGLPKPISGGFASVYQMVCNSKKYAVRCFRLHIPDQEQRYSSISNHLQQNQLPYMVGFKFLPQGIKIKGNWYPILKMEWIDGEQLNNYIEKNLNNGHILESLAQKFCVLISELNRCSIAHGDLQHGNILVVNGDFRLIDYDGMYVPALKGFQSHELGLGNYQHPGRTEKDFDLHLDNFSAWVIYISLLALSKEPSLWRKFDCGDEFLLFEKSDFENPYTSAKFTELQQVNDNDFNSIFSQFKSLINCNDISQIPPVKPIIPIAKIIIPSVTKESEQPPDDGASWVLDYIPIQPQHLSNHLKFERLLAIGALSTATLLSIVLIWIPFSFFSIIFSPLLFYVLILEFRFRNFSQVKQKKKLRLEMKAIDKDIKKIENEIQNKRDELSQKYSKKENEIKHQIEDCKKRETKEIKDVENKLRNIVIDLVAQKNKLMKSEKDEIDNELSFIQKNYMSNKLSQSLLLDAKIQGIGPEMKSRLLHAGINTAADITKIHNVNIYGIGPVKTNALLEWRRSLEVRFQQYMPKSLPTTLEASIKSKYSSQYQSLDSQRNKALTDAENEKNDIESKYNQEKSNLSRQLQDINNEYIKDSKNIDDEIARQKKPLSEKYWSFNKISREYDAYRHISFISYLKRIISINS